ncbi:winged helix-turn-helix domain-containing protein [Halobellus sp. Atlit-38R]|uniref:winged helix-turn-helix domain-containing protein n=1 Tax=Halobellus sp. Atlit-38R TaxID=2282131 RepID=UPI0018F7A752|nr:winged helix-turn-helix domain-containing protein [Halobellus sp. Atlit-38R]
MELNATDRQILTKLREGRVSPSYLAAELEKQQPYISQRLSHLLESGCIVRVHRGLYGHSATEGQSINTDTATEQFSDKELIEGPPQSAAGPTPGSEEAQTQPSPSDEFDIETIVDQITLVQEGEKRRVTHILQLLTDRIRESEYETRASLEGYLDQQGVDPPTRGFPQFWQFYLSGGELLTRIPGVTAKQDDNTTRYVYTESAE